MNRLPNQFSSLIYYPIRHISTSNYIAESYPNYLKSIIYIIRLLHNYIVTIKHRHTVFATLATTYLLDWNNIAELCKYFFTWHNRHAYDRSIFVLGNIKVNEQDNIIYVQENRNIHIFNYLHK